MKDYWESITEGNVLYQMGPQSHRVYLLDLLKEKGVKSLLDVGCGSGPIYELIINNENWDNITEYKGIDPAPSFIRTCKANFPNGKWEVEDARDLKEEDNSYDCVLLMHALDYVYEYEKAIQEAARVANKYVLIVLWRGVNSNPTAENHLNDVNQSKDGYDYSLATLQEFAITPLTKAFEDAGLKLLLHTTGEEINKEGKTNTLFLLEKI